MDRFIPLTLTIWHSWQGLASWHKTCASVPVELSGVVLWDTGDDQKVESHPEQVQKSWAPRAFCSPFTSYLPVSKQRWKCSAFRQKAKLIKRVFLVLWPASRLRDVLNVLTWKRISRQVQVDMLTFAPSALALIISNPPQKCWKHHMLANTTRFWVHGKRDFTFLASKPDRNNCIRAKRE